MLNKEKNNIKSCKKAAIFLTTMFLIASFLTPMASSGNPDVPAIEIVKTGPIFANVGDEITYVYNVINIGDVPINDIAVVDDKCGPVVFDSGDTDGDNALDIDEVWNFTCSYTPSFTFPSPLVNTATATGKYKCEKLEEDVEFYLYPFILRKEVLLYWEGENIDYDDSETEFTINMSSNGEYLTSFIISESAEKQLWLSEGTYQFTEINIPDGYLSAYDGITHITGENYPDFTQINVITFDLAIQKSGPKCAHVGDTITYNYQVTNAGPASVTPVVEDDKCGIPEFTGGDIDKDGLIDPGEVWTYKSDYTVGCGQRCLINTVNVTDSEGLGRSLDQWWLGGDRNISDNQDSWKVKVRCGNDDPEDPEEPEEPEQPEEPEEPEEPEQPEEPEEPTLKVVATYSPISIFYSNFLPVANASGIYSGNIEEAIEFDGSGSFDLDGEIVHFGWSFGDGSIGFGETITHTYRKGGNFLITLTVVDDKGASDIDTTTAIITVPNRPPSVPLISGPENGSKETDFSFAFGSSDLDNNDIRYTVDWGDGSSVESGWLPSGYLFSLLHSWAEIGEFTISVTASDNQTTSSAEMKVIIEENIVADNIVIIGLGIIAIFALLAALLYIKKGKK